MTGGDRHEAAREPARVKCLLVDDLEENLFALSALLRGGDVELLQARSGAEALELLLVNDVALALLDVQMPDMDGFQLAELMRGSERTRDVPIIFVTAGAHDQRRVFKGYESGAVDFLFKPIEPHILKSKAEVFFQLHRQKRQLARELHERTETLRLSEMFTAVLGHDLRNPLSTILICAELLQRSPDEGAQKIGTRLMSSGRWMRRMIEDLLDVARVRLGEGLALERQHVDLAALVQRVVQEREALLPQRRIELRTHGDCAGSWDADRLVQVVSNLVGNALHHGEADGPVEVQVDGTDAGAVVLRVTNRGRIPADVLPSIFDPFRSGKRRTSRAEGLGLGLYIVQQIVQAHAGSVQVHSGGDAPMTRFDVRLPRAPAPTP